jgi:hypothetical protein
MRRRGFFGACAAAVAAPVCVPGAGAGPVARIRVVKVDLIIRDETDVFWGEPLGEPMKLSQPRKFSNWPGHTGYRFSYE